MVREDLLRALEMFAKNWLAHDGCWFLAAEECFGMEVAIELDRRSWKSFAAAEARRIMTTFSIPDAGDAGGREGSGPIRPRSNAPAPREFVKYRVRPRSIGDPKKVIRTPSEGRRSR